jgi:putative tricarboxylic transport membrane protein
MRAHLNLWTGGALILLGAAIAVIAAGFPTLPIMAYGPGLFPKIVAAGLVLSGLGIALERTTPPAGDVLRPLPILAVLAVIAAFALTLDWLGFHVAGSLALLAAIRLFGGGWTRALLVAPIATALLHLLFYDFLRVPLPWGLLLPLAW